MKKLLSIGLLTVCALALTERQAQAWVNAKFSVGLNWHLQSANNNTLWGLYKNGQVPGPEAFGGGAAHPYGPIPFGTNPPGGTFPFYGSGPQGYPQQTPPAPQTAMTQQQQAYYPAAYQYGYNPFQAVSYQPDSYYYPSYYYPSYYQTYGYQVPSYWYQGR